MCGNVYNRIMKNKLLYFAILPALFFQLIGAYLYFVMFKGEDFSQIIYFVTKILLVTWPLIWLLKVKGQFLPLFGREQRSSLIVGGISALVIVVVVSLAYWFAGDFVDSFALEIREAAAGLNFLEHYILFSFFLSVIHSFIEEYYWRWFVLNGLMKKFSQNTAVVISSLAFAAHHLIVVMQFVPLYLAMIATFVIFLAGVHWSRLYLKSGSIAGSWLSHFAADAIIMTIGYLIIQIS